MMDVEWDLNDNEDKTWDIAENNPIKIENQQLAEEPHSSIEPTNTENNTTKNWDINWKNNNNWCIPNVIVMFSNLF